MATKKSQATAPKAQTVSNSLDPLMARDEWTRQETGYQGGQQLSFYEK